MSGFGGTFGSMGGSSFQESYAPFTTSGVLARPAGLPCGALAAPVNPMALSVTWSSSPKMSSFLKPQTVGAHVAPPGWVAKEPIVHMVHEYQAAGVDSVVDNTMRFRPCPPRWGKTREVGPAEIAPPFRILPTDKLAVNKGLVINDLPKLESSERLSAVLPPYSPSAPLFDNHYPPDRLVSGFIAPPKALSSSPMVDPATANYKASFRFQASSPNASPVSSMQKFDFDQTASHAHIPVKSCKKLFPGVAEHQMTGNIPSY